MRRSLCFFLAVSFSASFPAPLPWIPPLAVAFVPSNPDGAVSAPPSSPLAVACDWHMVGCALTRAPLGLAAPALRMASLAPGIWGPNGEADSSPSVMHGRQTRRLCLPRIDASMHRRALPPRLDPCPAPEHGIIWGRQHCPGMRGSGQPERREQKSSLGRDIRGPSPAFETVEVTSGHGAQSNSHRLVSTLVGSVEAACLLRSGNGAFSPERHDMPRPPRAASQHLRSRGQ